jgi:TnpA family transposase
VTMWGSDYGVDIPKANDRRPVRTVQRRAVNVGVHDATDLRIEEHYGDTAGFTDHAPAGFPFRAALLPYERDQALPAHALRALHRAKVRYRGATQI